METEKLKNDILLEQDKTKILYQENELLKKENEEQKKRINDLVNYNGSLFKRLAVENKKEIELEKEKKIIDLHNFANYIDDIGKEK